MTREMFIASMMLIFSGVNILFYHSDWGHQLPAPMPKDYQPIEQGKIIKPGALFTGNSVQSVFLHFFNPDCPCSCFNSTQFKALAGQYGSRVHSVVVVMSKKTYPAQEIRDKFDLKIPVVFGQVIAAACRVYSPGAQHKLYCPGNYSSSHYCTNAKNDYARIIALDVSPHAHSPIVFNPLALKATGAACPPAKINLT